MDSRQQTPASEQASHPADRSADDRRLYVLDPDWTVAVTLNAPAQYCSSRNVGEDYFHLILSGEIFLQNGDERLCLNCALRHNVISTDRLFWQNRSRRPKSAL